MHGDRAASAAAAAQDFLELREQPRVAAARREADHEPARLALAQLVDRRQLLRIDAPVVDELVVAQLALDYQDRVARDHRAVLLPDVVEEAHLDARAPVVEHERHARTAPAHLEHESRDRHVLAAAEALLACGPRAAEVHDARRRDLAQLLLVLGDRMAGQEEARASRARPAGAALRSTRAARNLDSPSGRRRRGPARPPKRSSCPAACARVRCSPSWMAAGSAAASEARVRPKRVEAAGLQHRLERALAREPEVHAPAEVDEVAERPAALALADDRLDRAFAHALDRAEAVADRAGPRDSEREARLR